MCVRSERRLLCLTGVAPLLRHSRAAALLTLASWRERHQGGRERQQGRRATKTRVHYWTHKKAERSNRGQTRAAPCVGFWWFSFSERKRGEKCVREGERGKERAKTGGGQTRQVVKLGRPATERAGPSSKLQWSNTRPERCVSRVVTNLGRCVYVSEWSNLGVREGRDARQDLALEQLQGSAATSGHERHL